MHVPLLQNRLADSISSSQLPETFSPTQRQAHVPVALLPFILATITFPLPCFTNLYQSTVNATVTEISVTTSIELMRLMFILLFMWR